MGLGAPASGRCYGLGPWKRPHEEEECFWGGGGGIVPNAIRQRTCQFPYGPMGLGEKYRKVGRDELCTSGPNLELGAYLFFGDPQKQIKWGRGVGGWGCP